MPFRPLFVLFGILILVGACDKYKPYRSQYQFKSSDGKPDYTDLNYWAAHPSKKDPSDSVSPALERSWTDSTVDVFFIHPTTHTKRKRKMQENARIDYDYLNAKTDYSTILYQASVFNGDTRVFAPRYRQAHLSNFFQKDTVLQRQRFDLAYSDVKSAFEYYMAHWNNGRPIIIAAHSQGSLMANWLLKEFFENKLLQNRLVVAYLPGWPVPKGSFSTLRMCEDSLQTGCICSWRTVRNGFIPVFVKPEKGNSYVTNPLNWTTTDLYAPKELNKGSVLLKFDKVYRHTTGARIKNGLLNIKKTKFPGSFFYFTRNYHIGDINLFYVNIRDNVRKRIALFWKK